MQPVPGIRLGDDFEIDDFKEGGHDSLYLIVGVKREKSFRPQVIIFPNLLSILATVDTYE